MKYDLIIFDCDGVLVDSEALSNKSFTELLNEIGLKISYEETHRLFTGRSDKDCHDVVNELLGRPAPADLMELHAERSSRAFREDLQPVKNIRELLDSLSGCKKCVASNAGTKSILEKLELTKLDSFFKGSVFSSDMVIRPKPYPDLYLFAAERMGTAPSRSAVVEDTVFGVRAGIAAGMKVFGYAELTNPTDLESAGAEVFFDMLDLKKLLNKGIMDNG